MSRISPLAIGLAIATFLFSLLQMMNAQNPPEGQDFVYIGQLYGESQSENFQQDKFLLLPRDFQLDTSYQQRGGVACCGGKATSDWDYNIPPGIFMSTGGGLYWAISRPGLDAIEKDEFGNVRQWRFGVFMYCGPEPPVGCNVKVNVWAKRKSAPLEAGIVCANKEKVYASRVPVVDTEQLLWLHHFQFPDHRDVGAGAVIDIIDKGVERAPGGIPTNVDPREGDCWIFGDTGNLQLRRVVGTAMRLSVEWWGGGVDNMEIVGSRLASLPMPPPRPSPPTPPPLPPPVINSGNPPKPPAQVGSCGSVPCISILANAVEDCGSDGIAPAMDIVNGTNKSATVTVLVTVNDGTSTWTRTDKYEAAPGRLYIGCSGSFGGHQRVKYSLVGVTWH